ncbi:MAG: acyl-CoA dehydrogenase family protein, partial [Solirubrobacterales bacterium]|nr:acyl-CoA dehydrogenase family protein [Solirubrobacterales bacterium]
MERPESAAQVVGKRTIFDTEQDDYRESFRQFLDKEVVPKYPEWERNHIVPKSLFTSCAEYGFLAMEVPEEYGGPGVEDWRFNVVLAEESIWAGVGPAMGGPLLHTDIVVPYITSTATEEQKKRWLPGVASGEKVLAVAMTEPGTGSDLAAISTRGKRDGDGWVVNGAKTFITNGINADIVITAVKTDPSQRHKGMSLLVLERGMEGFDRGRNLEKLGLHAQDTAELFFADVRVPAENLLGERGRGYANFLRILDEGRIAIAALSTGAAQGCVDESVKYAKEREAFGRPIGRNQAIAFKIARMEARAHAARTA